MKIGEKLSKEKDFVNQCNVFSYENQLKIYLKKDFVNQFNACYLKIGGKIKDAEYFAKHLLSKNPTS